MSYENILPWKFYSIAFVRISIGVIGFHVAHAHATAGWSMLELELNQAKWLVQMAEYFSENPQFVVNGFIRAGITSALDHDCIEQEGQLKRSKQWNWKCAGLPEGKLAVCRTLK